MIEAGTRSPNYGQIQRERQLWLTNKARQLREQHSHGGLRPESAAPAGATGSEPQQPDGPRTTNVTLEQKSRNLKGNEKQIPGRSHNYLKGRQFAEVNGLLAAPDQPGTNKQKNGESRRKTQDLGRNGILAVPSALEGGNASEEERIRRLEEGVNLWGGTYVPTIEEWRRRELIDKWSPSGVVQVKTLYYGRKVNGM